MESDGVTVTPPPRLVALLMFLCLSLAACTSSDAAPAPPAPAGVTADATSATSVHLMWNRAAPQSGVVSYEIHQDGEHIEDLPVQTYMTDITGLRPDTEYTFTVRATDAGGTASPDSEPVTATTLSADTDDDQPPTAPDALTGTADGAYAVSLSWSAATDNHEVTAYDIYQGETRIHSVGGDRTDAVVTGLRPDSDYRFTVVARDAADNSSPPSPVLALTTLPGTDEEPEGAGAPTEVTARYRTTSDSAAIDLTWVPPATGGDITDYEVYLDGEFVTTITWGAAAPSDEAAYTLRVDGPPPADGHTVKIRARLADGNWGAFSAQTPVDQPGAR